MDQPAAVNDPLTSPRRSARLATKKRYQQEHWAAEAGEKYAMKMRSHATVAQQQGSAEHEKTTAPSPAPQAEVVAEQLLGEQDDGEVEEAEREKLRELRVVELRAMLKSLGLRTAGRKEQLIDALVQARRCTPHDEAGRAGQRVGINIDQTESLQPCSGSLHEAEAKDASERTEKNETCRTTWSKEEHRNSGPCRVGVASTTADSINNHPLTMMAPIASTTFSESDHPPARQTERNQKRNEHQLNGVREEEDDNEEEEEEMEGSDKRTNAVVQLPGEERTREGAGLLLLAMAAVTAAVLVIKFGVGEEGVGIVATLVAIGVGVGATVGRALVTWVHDYLRQRRIRGQVNAAIASLEANRRTLRSFLTSLDNKRELTKLQLEQLTAYSSTPTAASSAKAAKLSVKLARISTLRDHRRATLRDLERQIVHLRAQSST